MTRCQNDAGLLLRDLVRRRHNPVYLSQSPGFAVVDLRFNGGGTDATNGFARELPSLVHSEEHHRRLCRWLLGMERVLLVLAFDYANNRDAVLDTVMAEVSGK